MKTQLHIVAVGSSLLALGLVGCSTLASRYPAFEKAVDDTEDIFVIVDVCMITDVKVRLDYIVLDDNERLAQRIGTHAQSELGAHGYRINTNVVTSIGGSLGENVTAKTVASRADHMEDSETVALPYFLHEKNLSQDDRESVVRLLSALLEVNPTADQMYAGDTRLGIDGSFMHMLRPRQSISKEVPSKEASQRGVRFVVLVTGRNSIHNTSVGDSLFGATASILGPGAILAALPVAVLQVASGDSSIISANVGAKISVWAVDSDDKLILWHEERTIGVSSPEAIVKTFDGMIEHLPDRPSQ